MPVQERSGFCKSCSKQVLVRRKGTSHLVHFIFTLLTGGIWLIVWILASIKIGGWRCTQCGSASIKSVR